MRAKSTMYFSPVPVSTPPKSGKVMALKRFAGTLTRNSGPTRCSVPAKT